MAFYRIADLLFDIVPRYELLARVCEPYRVAECGMPDARIEISEQQLRETVKRDTEHSVAYAENLCACRAVSQYAAAHGVILFHAAVVEVDGKAYAFSAPSGTGKSTHIRLWRRVYGERVGIINGDKPLLRERDGILTVYGTPWCGKEGWNRNTSAPLAGLCFIERAEQNRIRRMENTEAVERIFTQLLKPDTPDGVAETLRVTDLLIRNIPVYLLSCNMTEEAARTSFEAMVKGESNEN